ncbi:unnamed protein product, partial [Prorocentrum cordatum]
GMTCHYCVDDSGEMDGFRPSCRPQIIEANSGSCIYNAIQQATRPFNNAGIADICKVCPWAILNELPDDCSANKRNKLDTPEHLPDNGLAVDGRCSAHQGHRIVEHEEKLIIGHIHAVHVSRAHMHNRLIMKHTMLRRRALVAGRPELGPTSDELSMGEASAAEKFLKYWNGDWTQHVPSHWCLGCCKADPATGASAEDDCRQNLFAAAVGVD